MSGPLPIRQATADDALALAALRYEFRAALATPREQRDAFVARCREWMERQLRDPASAWRCWLAADAEGPVGTVWVYWLPKIPNPVGEREAHAYVTNFYVRPALRGHGTGGRLLGAALAWCRSQPIDSVILWPTPASRPLYLRHGFERGDGILELPLNG